jgi:hypothetical protein
MSNISNHSVVAVFPNHALAEAAIDELWHAGFKKDEIGLAGPGEQPHDATTPTGRAEDKAAHAAATGAVTGSVAGAVAGLVVAATIPGFGPVVAGGLLLGILGGAAAGAALGTFAGPFLAMGLSKEQAKRYEAEFRFGRTIVIVRAKDRHDEAVQILHSHGPLRVEEAETAAPV